MSEERDESSVALLYLIMAAVVAYVVIYIVLMLGVILTICLTAGAGYLGYRAAFDSQLWESRRIAKDRKLEAARQAGLAYYQGQNKEWMGEVVNNYYDDRQRQLYANDASRIDNAVNTIRKIRESLK